MVGNVIRLPAVVASLFDMIDEIWAKVNGVTQLKRPRQSPGSLKKLVVG
jgi:hypothetical protein